MDVRACYTFTNMEHKTISLGSLGNTHYENIGWKQDVKKTTKAETEKNVDEIYENQTEKKCDA